MIGKLSGTVDSIAADTAILDVGGVGYLVHASTATLASLPRLGEKTSMLIETHVREDRIQLIGFASESERDWYRLLLGLQGVGTKVALAVLGALPPRELARAIALGDRAAVVRAPGVGPKVAQRIVTELKDKVPALAEVDPVHRGLVADLDDARAPRSVADAVSALLNLGYAEAQATGAVAAAMRNSEADAPAERLIRLALRELAK